MWSVVFATIPSCRSENPNPSKNNQYGKEKARTRMPKGHPNSYSNLENSGSFLHNVRSCQVHSSRVLDYILARKRRIPCAEFYIQAPVQPFSPRPDNPRYRVVGCRDGSVFYTHARGSSQAECAGGEQPARGCAVCAGIESNCTERDILYAECETRHEVKARYRGHQTSSFPLPVSSLETVERVYGACRS